MGPGWKLSDDASALRAPAPLPAASIKQKTPLDERFFLMNGSLPRMTHHARASKIMLGHRKARTLGSQ